jgi:hypothetical protein
MIMIESYSQFIAGLQKIERGIIDGVRVCGGEIDARKFSMAQGQHWLPPPSAVELAIKVGHNAFSAVLSREQVSDSCREVSRPDVVNLVDEAVAQLTNSQS